MSDDTPTPDAPEPVLPPLSPEEAARRAALPETARRALEEADLRKAKDSEAQMPVELGGRDGPEPVRYGDWEKKGIAIDF
ncbi:DUF1674 domain-containing protein [Dinoroseobacter sp. S124A]|uniref:DUF1674 domain-containing protein n=1 Tax=Dinoroseobacter sp. S124A TaxID=3415128 RepID=UPI003C7A6E8E